MFDDDEYDDENMFQAERKAYERAGYGGTTSDVLGLRMTKAIQDPNERFNERLNGVFGDLRNNFENITITNNDMEKLREKIESVDRIEYKNPTAYVLGYLATSGGKKIDDKILQDIFGILGKISDLSVKQEDVIRYCRLWTEVL